MAIHRQSNGKMAATHSLHGKCRQQLNTQTRLFHDWQVTMFNHTENDDNAQWTMKCKYHTDEKFTESLCLQDWKVPNTNCSTLKQFNSSQIQTRKSLKQCIFNSITLYRKNAFPSSKKKKDEKNFPPFSAGKWKWLRLSWGELKFAYGSHSFSGGGKKISTKTEAPNEILNSTTPWKINTQWMVQSKCGTSSRSHRVMNQEGVSPNVETTHTKNSQLPQKP